MHSIANTMFTFVHYGKLKAFLTVQKTAKILGMSVPTVYRLINSGELHAKKIRTRYMIVASDLEKYINR